MPSILSQRTAARDVASRFAASLELLGDATPTSRLAGIYALEGLMNEPKADAKQLDSAIIEVFSEFVRRYAAPIEGAVPKRISVDIQAALTVLGRASNALSSLDRPLDLHGISLREAYLPRCRFERAFLYDCDFEGALLVGANLRGAWLGRANLTRANLDGADLRGADLSGALGVFPAQIEGAQWDAETRWPQARDFARPSVMEGTATVRRPFEWDSAQSSDPDA